MVYRWSHNARCEQPRLIGFFDTETTEIPHATDERTRNLYFKMGVARIGTWDGSTFNGVEERLISRPCQFWEMLHSHCRSKRVLWLFAHNVMFDLWVLQWPELVDRGEFTFLQPGKSPSKRKGETGGSGRRFLGQFSAERGSVIIKGKYRGQRVNFVDSGNYFRGSIDSIGTSIGLAKLPMPMETAGERDWFHYCRRDVEVIEQAVCGLLLEWRANNLGNWQPTIAGLAFSSYRHRFMSRPPVAHQIDEVSKLERSSYYDGRTTPFYLGRCGEGQSLFGLDKGIACDEDSESPAGPYYHVDVSSLYPSVMRGHDYPVEAVHGGDGRPIIWSVPNLEWLREQLESYLCIGMCQIATESDWYPVRYSEGVRYPIGRFWTPLATPEVRLALDNGHLHAVSWCILYHKHQLFNSWVDYWWERKRQAEEINNPVRREVCKLLLNGLAGKFAQRERYWKNTDRFPREDSAWKGWGAYDAKLGPVRLRSIGQQVQINYDAGDAPHALVAVSAHINSYARVRMLHDRLALPERSVLYQANDAFILTAAGYHELLGTGKLDNGECGGYRTIAEYGMLTIHGPRDYVANGQTVKAGLPKIRTQVAERRWDVQRFECANSLISRPPDGSVHLYADTVSGSESTWGSHGKNPGWQVPNRVDLW